MDDLDGKRLIILGGGISALTTAFYASDPTYRTMFPGGVHVYEKAALLGGKGASTRRTAGGIENRIEEHGLHVWFGSYDNAFALLHKCHEYLNDKERWATSMRSVEDGFRPCSRVAAMEHDGSGWLPWVAEFPEDSSRPWHPRRDEDGVFSPVFLATRALRLAEAFLYSLGSAVAAGRRRSTLVDGSILPLPIRLPQTSSAADVVTRVLSQLPRSGGGTELLGGVLKLLSRAALEFRNRFDETLRCHSGIRRIWCMVDLLLAMVRGLIDHGVLHTGDLTLIDHFDLRAWLVRNGATEEAASFSLLKALIYDLDFAYEGGDPEKPRCSAAVGVFGLFRLLLTYRGAVLWKMNAGMGEVVFAPIYEALIRRGVNFHFGHEVKKLTVRQSTVTRIDLEVHDIDRPQRLPVIAIEDGPLAGTLPYWPPESAAKSRSLDALRIRDGDMIIYAMPVGTIKELLPVAPRRWRECGDKVQTVGTAALQLWLNVPVERYAPWASPDITVGAYTEPFDTWSDMKVLVGEKSISRKGSISSVAYFANIVPPISEAAATAAMSEFIDHGLGGLWPSFQPEMEIARFTRVNLDTSSSYALSLPGTLKYRLSPRDCSITNMRPVGDWTRNSINSGCIEAAVISGMIGAEAVLGCKLEIVGESI
jgi:uncharacterized protein with NAD-binding domain and iron-sulfur cluster